MATLVKEECPVDVSALHWNEYEEMKDVIYPQIAKSRNQYCVLISKNKFRIQDHLSQSNA